VAKAARETGETLVVAAATVAVGAVATAKTVNPKYPMTMS
jgi:hypothetical protein